MKPVPSISRRAATAAVCLAALALALPVSAQTQSAWPNKPVRIVVPFAPGGTTDLLARALAPEFSKAFGQQFVVENRAGAGGNIGTDAVAKAAPDGYLFGITTDTLFTVNPLVYRKLPFDPWGDIRPVTLLGSFSQMMVCHAALPAKTLAELLQLAKREKLSYASGGPGVPGHLAAELLFSITGASMLHVPYKGPAAATADVMGGQVNCGFLATPTVLPHVKSGKLTGLAVSTAKRSPLAPDIPAAAEAGAPGFDAPFYLVLFTQKGTPVDITALMNREVAKALGDPTLKERAAALDIVTLGGSPEEASRVLKAAAAKWAPVVQRIGLKLD
jgi:tripartite-type tricarboxylate transporter receptor subunit TctC